MKIDSTLPESPPYQALFSTVKELHAWPQMPLNWFEIAKYKIKLWLFNKIIPDDKRKAMSLIIIDHFKYTKQLELRVLHYQELLGELTTNEVKDICSAVRESKHPPKKQAKNKIN